jgi:N-acetylmuramoyl-L-alanine amidase
MRRALVSCLLAVIIGVGPSLAAARGVVVESMRLDGSETAASLVLELSGATPSRLFNLEGPDRVVLDLPATQLGAGVKLPAGAGLVEVLRSGVQPGATLRLVLETRGSVPARSRLVRTRGDHHRLTLDLGAPTPAPASASAADIADAVAAADGKPSSQAPVVVRSVRAAGEGRDIIIAIDAGHGGQDPGAIGRSGTREKDVVLGIAKALARRIDAEPGMRAVLTRAGDSFIPLRERMSVARTGRADLFVSVHADAIANRSVAGSSVYVLSDRGASSEQARWLAERENAADLKGGVSLGDKQGALASVLMDLSQTASIGSSIEAAERVLGYMDRIGEVRKSQVQQAAFVVLKSPDIPSMLVETAYISNPAEEKRLRTTQHQERIANAIFSGVRDYFRASPPDGSFFAQQRSRGGAAPIMAVNAGR